MIEIILDASQIETFENCPLKWAYSYLLHLTPVRSYKAFDIGSYYHEVLHYYYKLKLEEGKSSSTHLKIALQFAAYEELLKKFHISALEDQKFHQKRLIDYFLYFANEDEGITPIALEEGFSWLLYEDSQRRYILEGKIDFVGHGAPYGLFVMDHKTQSRKEEKWGINHQLFNYMSFMKSIGKPADYFVYNYIGLQDKLPPGGLRRSIYKPQPGMLEQWQKDVFRTFQEVESLLANAESCFGLAEKVRTFPRRRSACAGKYNPCQFHKICGIPDDSKFVPAIMTHYKEKDEKWRAWS